MVHDLCGAAVGTHGKTPANDLAERAQVRRDAVVRLRPAKRNAEPGHDLVEDK